MDASLMQILWQAGVTILVALITTFAAVYATRKQDKRTAEKQGTDRAAQLNKMALELIEPYQHALIELRTEFTKLQAKYDVLECDLIKERKKRQELEEINAKKDTTIAAMQVEIDDLRGKIEALQKERRK